MKLVSFSVEGRSGIGALNAGGEVIDLAADPSLPSSMAEFIALGASGLDRAAAVAGNGASAVEDVRIEAPIRPRNNVMAIGKNYHAHAKEFADSGFDTSSTAVTPENPIVFTKALSSIIAPGDGISLSSDPSGTTDYEGELGVVIGRGGTKISKANAMDHVYGYVVINDVTAREVQRQHVQFFVGKSGVTFCPMGPAIVTADEIADVEALQVQTRVNGDLRQDQPIADLIFDIPTIIEAISASVLLEPGDVIATGTPSGVGIGFDPPLFLAEGDEVEVHIEGVGTLTNPVVA
ncbi:MAG: fumarylacetoacetate hydrolase family protein [Acidimicrobiales bacterium]